MVEELQNFRNLYPQYNDIDDLTLANLLAQKFPVYSDLVERVKKEKIRSVGEQLDFIAEQEPVRSVMKQSRIPFIGNLEDFLASWKSMYDGFRAGGYDFFTFLDKCADLASKLTGFEKEGLFKRLAEWVKPEDATDEKNLAQKISYVIGGVLPTITKFMLLSRVFGPALGFAGTEAIEASPKGAKEAIKEGVKGYAMGGILKAIEPLKSLLRIPILSGIFGGEALFETGKIEEAIPGAVLGAGFGAMPGGEMGLKEVVKSKIPEIRIKEPIIERPIPVPQELEKPALSPGQGFILVEPKPKVIRRPAPPPKETEIYIRKPDGTFEKVRWSEEEGRYVPTEEKPKIPEAPKVIETPEGTVIERPLEEPKIVPQGSRQIRKFTDLGDWIEARNAELREVEKIPDPHERIKMAEMVRDKYNAMKDPNWVTNDIYASKIIVDALDELEAHKTKTPKEVVTEKPLEEIGVVPPKKEPWEMTYREFFDIAGSEYTAGSRFGIPTKNRVPIERGATPEERIHKAVIRKAIEEGKKVPDHVLAEYKEFKHLIKKTSPETLIEKTLEEPRIVTKEEAPKVEEPISEKTIYSYQRPKINVGKKPDLITWLRQKGGINENDPNIDTTALKRKESGYVGLVSKRGKFLDELRDEAEWEGVIPPGITTDELSEIISDRIMFGKAKYPEPGTKEFERFIEKAEREYYESLEAWVKGGKVGPIPKYATGSSINLERIETTNDVKHFLDALTQSIEAKIGKRRVSWEETRQKAEELNWNINDLRRAWNRKGAFSAAEIEAARQLNINAISELHEMLRTLPADRTTYTPEQRAKLLDAIEAVKVTSQASSEAGRALNIHKRILARDPEFRKVKDYNRVLRILERKGAERTDQIINALKKVDFENPAEVNRFIYSVTRTKWEKLTDGAYELWINGLLSNPLTHIVNTTSNALTLAFSYPERFVGAGIEAIRAKITKTPRERFFGETFQEVFSFAKALKDASKRFFDVMAKGEEISKLEAERRISPLPPRLQKILPGRALTAEDAFFKSFIESQELNRLAARKAISEGLKGEELKNRITELLKNPTEEMLEQAAQRAKYLTYQKELGRIGNLVLRARETVPGLKYFIPFVRTPANIAKYALERSPLNIPRIVYKTAKGELRGGGFSDEAAKALIGSLVAAGIYLLAEEGMVTGGGPKDKNERDELYRKGWQPYSFKIGNKYYSFARLEPFGSIFGMAADFKEIMEHATEDEKYNIVSGIASSIQKNISNKTFMQGFSQISDFLSDPGRYGEKALNNLVGSIIPALSAGVARSIDEDLREPKNVIEAIKARIPELSKTVEARVNIWGEPIKRPGTPVSRFISPLQISEEKLTPIDEELVRLKLNIGMPSKKIFNGELTDEEYLQYIKLSGPLLKKALNNLVQTEEYKDAPEEVKEKQIKNVVSEIRDRAKMMIFNKMSVERKKEVTKSKYGEYYVLRH